MDETTLAQLGQFETQDDGNGEGMELMCTRCGQVLCGVDDCTSLEQLVSAAVAHGCGEVFR